jgi:lysozyme
MKLDQAGLEFIKQWEGCRLEAYEDVVGKLTIGVGHLLTDKELESGELLVFDPSFPTMYVVNWRDGITDDDAMNLLAMDAADAEAAVDDLVDVELTQNQFNALVSFVFNLGRGAFAKSTLLTYVNEHYPASFICGQFMRWVHAGGRVVQGLVNRRMAECRLWEKN